jgi:hypothetical protein
VNEAQILALMGQERKGLAALIVFYDLVNKLDDVGLLHDNLPASSRRAEMPVCWMRMIKSTIIAPINKARRTSRSRLAARSDPAIKQMRCSRVSSF